MATVELKHYAAGAFSIGEIRLNKPQSLNAQDSEMVKAISRALYDYEADPTVAMVLIRGEGEKAFCAGGDIRSIFHALKSDADRRLPNAAALDFFAAEYALCRQVYRYSKPVIAWANGIVMGGGLGLASAASYRIVTETTMMAMPEAVIGLHPDAGGSWFLQRVPGRAGLFLALTGAAIRGRDALLSSLANYALPSSFYTQLVELLQVAVWDRDVAANHRTLSNLLHTLHREEVLPPSELIPAYPEIHAALNVADVQQADALLRGANFSTPWLQAAQERYVAACPVSVALIWEVFRRAKFLSLEEALCLELNATLHCCHRGDFEEGVRALLIDKDKQPRFSRALYEVTADYVASHFDNPLGHEHPFTAWF